MVEPKPHVGSNGCFHLRNRFRDSVDVHAAWVSGERWRYRNSVAGPDAMRRFGSITRLLARLRRVKDSKRSASLVELD